MQPVPHPTSPSGFAERKPVRLARDRVDPLIYSLVLVVICLALVVGWSVRIRFNAAPDEYSHFFLVEYLTRFHAMPRPWIDPKEPFHGPLSGALYHARIFWYYGMPNLHAFAATATAQTWTILTGLPASPLAARAFNWSMFVLFALGLQSIARSALRKEAQGCGAATAWCLALSVATIPQVTFIFAYLNSDAFGLAILTLTLAALLRLFAKPITGRAIVFGVSLGLLLCAKIYFLPATPLLFGLILARRLEGVPWPPRKVVIAGICAALAVSVPVMVTTAIWYGDALGMRGQQDFADLYGADPKYLKGMCFFFCAAGPVVWSNIWWWTSIVFKSFFYDLGWMEIVLPVRVYQLFFLPLLLVPLAASVAGFRRRNLTRIIWRRTVIGGFWLLLLFLIASNLAGSQRLLPQPQGRYLYAILPFIPLLLCVTLAHLKSGNLLLAMSGVICVGMLACNIAGAIEMGRATAHPIQQMPGFADTSHIMINGIKSTG